METNGSKSKQNSFKAFPSLTLMVLTLLTAGSAVFSQTTVSSPSALLEYLDDDNVDVKLSPGTYSISAADVKDGTYRYPIFCVKGNNSTYDFTGVTINFDTDLLQAFGNKDVYQIQILGNNNVLKNLKMVDVGSKTDHPIWRATNLVMDGSHNRVEGFHMTVKGSWPYGYSDHFGKGAKFAIKHHKHCGLLVRGESNHVKNVTMIHRSYGHGIYMQAANNAIVEGCYVEGEVRTTDDMLAEKGTGSPADKVDFKGLGDRQLRPGDMMSLQEEGIRAYNGGETWIDGKEYNRGTHNLTVLNNTVKYMRGGVTITHATGKKYVEGCTTIGCESGYKVGSGDIVNCSSDFAYGPAFDVDYDSDKNITADITILPSEHYYGNKTTARVIGHNHKITLRSSESNPNPAFPVNIDRSSDVEIHNLTQYPLALGSRSSGTTGESIGTITDNGSNNAVKKIEGNIATSDHPRLFVNNKERQSILDKIENEDWAGKSWEGLKKKVDPYVDRHVTDPEWIVSRLAMYWKEGQRYTQCYIKKQNWDYGEGNAPVPTVRLPGMRTWNNYINVPLEGRIPYNESGDMLAIDRSSEDKTPVLVPYKNTGHMVRYNNAEILQLAETASFAYWLTNDEKYAKFSADIFWTWILGIYYMNPPLDPERSTRGLGGYEPGGIMGYYDYEQIHDDRQEHAAVIYDFLHDYLNTNPNKHLSVLNKDITEVAGIVFKRFVEIGLVRGGKSGNWNVNGFQKILPSMLVLESNEYYDDNRGREYYIPFYTKNSTRYHTALPDFITMFNSNTGLWPESPGYASTIISTVLDMGIPLYKSGINTIADNPLLQKAAMANLGWLDARGNLVVFGDMRGGPTSFDVFEKMLTYYTLEGDLENAKKMAIVIRKGIESGQYNRNEVDWKGICLYQPLPESGSELPFHRAAYSEFHRHIIMRNGNSEENGLMFTLYGGKSRSHLSSNGLAMQFYGKGWVLATDAAAYESYWSDDMKYHSAATGSNTIMPGYTQGDITINAMDPAVDPTGFYNTSETSPACSFADVSAQEKRRLVAMVRTSPTTGYYVDIFRSDQPDNDYVYHNLGNTATFKDATGQSLALQKVDDMGVQQHPAYSFYKNPRKADYNNDFWATWNIKTVTPNLNVDLWMMGQDDREIYLVDAPPTTLRSDLTPGMVNKSPQTTPTMILRQTNNNAKSHPFVAVFEPYNEGEKSIEKISKIADSENFICIAVESKLNSRQMILNAIDEGTYKPKENVVFQGTFGIASENDGTFEYLYLGKGKLFKNGAYQIEAVDGTVSAELRMVDGRFYYSADKPVKISLKNGKVKEYPAGYNLAVN